MTYEEARNSGVPFNRAVYEDGWYTEDRRGVDCSCRDLSQRFWTEKDLKATDWILKKEEQKKISIPAIKKYNIIYMDPPWDYKRKGGPKHIGMAAQIYPTLKDDDVYTLNIEELAANDCFLFCWCTWPKLQEGMIAIERWGFRYVTVAFVWIKTNKKQVDSLFWGSGHYCRANTEVCLLGVRGKPKVLYHGVHQVVPYEQLNNIMPSEVISPNIQHSAKPPEVRERIIKLCGDIPRIELFARGLIDNNWDFWGDESCQ